MVGIGAIAWCEAIAAAGLLAQAPGAEGSPFGALFVPMSVILLMAYFLLIRPQQTKQRRYDEMIANLKQNDRVVTTGGLHGVVTAVQRDAGWVTLRLDDATGAKVRVAVWAVSHLAADENAGEKTKPAKAKEASKQQKGKPAGGKRSASAGEAGGGEKERAEGPPEPPGNGDTDTGRATAR